MADHRLIAAPDPRDDALAAYLADLAARLRGPRRRRAAILAELSDGLDRAVQEHRAAGLPAGPAATAAIVQFGAPQAVADAFGGELATAYARHAIVWFIATGPLVGVWWLLLLDAVPWRSGPAALFAAIPVLPLIAVAIAAAAGTVATTGSLMRWLPETGPYRALTATIAIAALCLVGDLTMITMFLASGVPTRPLATVALAVSFTRVVCSVATMWQATRMRSRSGMPRGPEGFDG
jgi:hypothetical protein